MGIIEISYFSDVLCVWAYISEVRIDAIKEKFGEAVRIEHHFCSVFGDTATKVNTIASRVHLCQRRTPDAQPNRQCKDRRLRHGRARCTARRDGALSRSLS